MSCHAMPLSVSRGISKAADMGAACREIRDEINACRQSFLLKVKAGKTYKSYGPIRYTAQLKYVIRLNEQDEGGIVFYLNLYFSFTAS